MLESFMTNGLPSLLVTSRMRSASHAADEENVTATEILPRSRHAACNYALTSETMHGDCSERPPWFTVSDRLDCVNVLARLHRTLFVHDMGSCFCSCSDPY